MLTSSAEGESGRVDRFYDPHRVALDAGDQDQAANRIARQAKVVFHPDFGGVLDLPGGPPQDFGQPGGGHGAGDPTSPWQPTSAPEMEAFILKRVPMAAAVNKNRTVPSSSAPGQYL